MNGLQRKLEYHPNVCVDGIHREKSKNIGYCWYSLHRGYVTVAIMKKHRCTEKSCTYLEKFENAQYWAQKYERKIIKLEKRAREKFIRENERLVLDGALELTFNNCNVLFIKAVYESKKRYTLSYIADGYVDLSYCAYHLSFALDCAVRLKCIRADRELIELHLDKKRKKMKRLTPSQEREARFAVMRRELERYCFECGCSYSTFARRAELNEKTVRSFMNGRGIKNKTLDKILAATDDVFAANLQSGLEINGLNTLGNSLRAQEL